MSRANAIYTVKALDDLSDRNVKERFEDAAKYFDLAIELNKNDPDYHYNKNKKDVRIPSFNFTPVTASNSYFLVFAESLRIEPTYNPTKPSKAVTTAIATVSTDEGPVCQIVKYI